ncbi:MAG: hypothetical protein CL607_14025 [Anaerolineaceae bacterium]|nr:hypothetical protein [Anaerolineaceae bacterium]
MFDLQSYQSPEAKVVWQTITQIVAGLAPSSGADLPGAVGDTIAELATQLVPDGRIVRNFKNTGNMALQLGPPTDQPDLVITAHMDRPTFCVRSIDEQGRGSLFPICAIRLPEGQYRTGARSFRFEAGMLVVGATGHYVAVPNASDDYAFYFEPTEGHLTLMDTIVMETPPRLDETTKEIVSTGFDNTLGVTVALFTAQALAPLIGARACWFVFTDHEEGPPNGYYFSQGSDRLTRAIPAPRIGAINVDAHNAGEGLPIQLGKGASFAMVSGDGKGAVVPPNYVAMANDLKDYLNTTSLAQVQFNPGYLSRSDEMPMHRWSRLLAMIGPPLAHAHTGNETANLTDVVDSITLLTHISSMALGTSPEATAAYHLSFD